MNVYLDYLVKHGFWLSIILVIILEWFFINRWGNENVMLLLILASIGFEISHLKKEKIK